MRYKIELASGADFEISWGNFQREEYFGPFSFIYSLETISEYFEATNQTYKRDGRTVKYIYGTYGSTPKEIFDRCLKSFTDNKRVIRVIDSGAFEVGEYVYSIEINSLDDLKKLMEQFDERLILGIRNIIIYDSYVE